MYRFILVAALLINGAAKANDQSIVTCQRDIHGKNICHTDLTIDGVTTHIQQDALGNYILSQRNSQDVVKFCYVSGNESSIYSALCN